MKIMVEHICAVEDAPRLYGDDVDVTNTPTAESAFDSLLWAVLTERVLNRLGREMVFCELGAGMGGWSRRILREHPIARGVALIDSPGIVAAEIGNRQERLKAYSLTSMPLSMFEQHSFDLTFSFSRLLARSRSPEAVLKELVRVTKPRGYIVLLVPSMHHAVSWNLTHARIHEAERALSGRGTYGAGMPESNLYTRESIEALLTEAGACPEATLGLPPCAVEASTADIHDSASAVSVSSESVREKIVDIEKRLIATSALRGTSLLAIARTPYARGQWGQFWQVE